MLLRGLLCLLCVFSISACSSSSSDSKSNNDGGGVIGQGLDSDFAKQLVSQPRCLVESSPNALPSHIAVVYIFTKEGKALGQLFESKDGKLIKNNPITLDWGYDNNTVALKDDAGNISKSRPEWITYTPKISADSILKTAIQPGPQTCLKAQSMDAGDENSYGITMSL